MQNDVSNMQEISAEEIDLFAEEIEDRSNAASGTIFCVSTEGCICTFTSIKPE